MMQTLFSRIKKRNFIEATVIPHLEQTENKTKYAQTKC